MQEIKDTINIFWTGGQDSTFRLIQLLTTTSKIVQPHYIIRHEDSTGFEIETMIRIRRAIIRKFPDVRSRFLPTIYTNEDCIPTYKEIDDGIEEIRKLIQVNEQYQIMSRYCKKFNIEKIEVCYERDVSELPGDLVLSQYFGNSEVFENFLNPLEELTKRECYHNAKLNGWDDILNMTSFCRRPEVKINACGVCGPCVDVMRNGLGFRLSLKSRIKARVQIPFRNYYRKNYLKKNTSWFFKLVKRKFEHRL